MTSSNGSGNLTYKWLVPLLIAALFTIGGVLLADQRDKIKEVKTEAVENAKANKAKIDCLERDKLDKELYYRDMRDIKLSLSDISNKLDALRVRK